MSNQAAAVSRTIEDVEIRKWLGELREVSRVDGHCANRLEAPDGTEYHLPGTGAASLPDDFSEYVRNDERWTTKYVSPHNRPGTERSYE